MAKLTVIGVGSRPLDEKARQAVLAADVVFGPGRACELFSAHAEFGGVRERIRQVDGIDAVIASIKEALGQGRGRVVLLASGDPLFFGIGRRASRELGRERVEFMPDVSSLQLAFASVGQPWDDALLVSFHGASEKRKKYGMEELPALLSGNATIAALTDKDHGPAAIARVLEPACSVWPSLRLHVCERLGCADERVREGTPSEIAAMAFDEPNVVIINRGGDGPGKADDLPAFGLREEEIDHEGGLITKDEVRAVTIHALRLPAAGVLWDVGAGSGAVSVEAARLCPRLRIFAVEKDAGRTGAIAANRGRFGLSNISIAKGEAPGALSTLPGPCRVFIGGSGGRLGEIIDTVGERMDKGMAVINAATLETLNEAMGGLERNGFRVRVSQVSVARVRPAGDKRLFAGLNPVFVVSGEKG